VRVILFTGKGGVGKTTTAAATAVHAARCGVKTLVISADSAHSLADTLAAALRPTPSEVAPGLFAQQVDPRARSERSWRMIQDYLLAALDELDVDPLAAEELTELPGADEVFSLLEVRDQVRDGPWDLVVVDCAPSTETLRLLAAPEVTARYVQRLLPMERRIARIVSLKRPGWTARPPGGVPLPGDAVVEAATRFAAELAGAQEVLRAPSTSVRLVMTPESVVLAETRRTWTALALHGFVVDAVVANRVFAAGPGTGSGSGPGSGSGSGSGPGSAQGPGPGPAMDEWRSGWSATHERVLAEAKASFTPVPVQSSSYAAAEPIGVEALAVFADALYGPAGSASALLTPPVVADPFRVDRSDGGYLLRVPLPLAAKEDLDLGRRGDDLVVTVDGRRRVLALPSALRRCQVEGAALRDGALAIRFVPDPDQWRHQWLDGS
jgi:arsenite/tail-anchored protein-transporting ATPase